MRQMLASVSSPAILQWFDSSFRTVEERTPDIFEAGYGAVWLPPPGRADSGNFSVGYDVYDRFDLGKPDRPTLYGTETELKTISKTFDKAGIALHVDAVLNHAGFSDFSTPGFVNAGGYPGLAITLPGAIDGDFHSSFESGDLRGRLSGLVDINHSTNHQFIRQPVDANDSRNIPSGNTPAFGRLANVPTEENLRFYPDRNLAPIFLFDPATGESGIAVYPFNPDCNTCGDPVMENALGYQLRYLQWLVQEIGVDGLRLDATKHFDPWVLNYLDRAVYRSNPRMLLNGSVDHVFSYGEAFTSDKNQLMSYIRKDINSTDPGRIGGNRDTLDFSAFFAMKANLSSAGTANAWRNIRDSLLDLHDDGIHNGSAGVLFVSSHDENGPFALGNVAQAFVMMYPGNATVYFNGKEFGEGRDFPKDGRGDALGGVYGNGLKRLVQIRNTHGRGNFRERWIDNQGIYVYERESSAVVGLSNRGDNGFDTRTVTVAFAPGTHLVELTGNAANSVIDPFNDIPEVVTVKPDGTVDIRIPRNRNANGDFHGNGYVIYGLPTPQASAGLEIIGATTVLPGTIPAANNFANGMTRLSDLTVITTDTFSARLQTNEVRLLGLDALRDIFADGDSALLRLDGGSDANGNGSVDFVSPGNVAYGFETFGNTASPLIGSGGISGPRGNGLFLQTIDATKLAEGVHYLEARAFRHRTDGGPAVYSDFKESIYVDRLAPISAVKSFEPFVVGVNENRNLIIESLDKTANSVHVFLDLPAATTDAAILAMVSQANSARRIDRDQFIYGFSSLSSGNHVATIVTFERTGNVNVQRSPGLSISTIFGAGLGDVDLDGDIDIADHTRMLVLVNGNNTEFIAAADFDANGFLDQQDYRIFLDEFIDQVRGPIDFGDAGNPYLRPYFSDRITEIGPLTLSVPGGNINLQATQHVDATSIQRSDLDGDSLYFRFTINPTVLGSTGISNAFAGLQLWNDGVEGVGIGKRFGSTSWSYFGAKNSAGQTLSGELNSPNADAGVASETIAANVARTFLVRIQYQPGQDDLITVWMQPGDVLDSFQAPVATTSFLADASFDQLRVRAGSGSEAFSWAFSNIHVAKQLKPGPAHLISNDLRLGFLVDPDGGQQPSSSGNGDDINGSDDEDGIQYDNPITKGSTWSFRVGASGTGLLDAWIDYNQNGSFEHPAEHISNGTSQQVNLGLQTINVAVPSSAIPGSTMLRIRVSSQGGLEPNSYASDGEVEDHLVLVTNPIASVVARHVFYNNATGANLSSEGAANNSIDTSKSALRIAGEQSTFANYTNYSRGLNGIVFDIANLPETTTASEILASLQLRHWNGISSEGFVALPASAIPTLSVLRDNGGGAAARIKVTFPDNTLRNTWLRVTVLANASTGLESNDIFYFGNVVGELNTGNTSTRLRVNATDTGLVRSNQSTSANSASVTNIFDVNRDGRVNATDTGIVRSNQQTAGIVAPISVPASAPAASAPPASAPPASAPPMSTDPISTGLPSPLLPVGLSRALEELHRSSDVYPRSRLNVNVNNVAFYALAPDGNWGVNNSSNHNKPPHGVASKSILEEMEKSQALDLMFSLSLDFLDSN